MAWLHYEVIAFYANLAACIVFLVIANFKKFRSFRDRSGLASKQQRSVDFLSYCKDDIHWFQIWFCQVSLYVCGLIFKTNRNNAAGVSSAYAGAIILFGLILVNNIYFNSREPIAITNFSKVFLIAMVVASIMMIQHLLKLFDSNSIWWAPVILEIIIAHFCIFF